MAMTEPHTPHPLRVQRKRTKGYRMPSGVVYVGRPTKWGNPYGTVEEYRIHVLSYFKEEIREELAGKQLACWCSLDKPCHADVLCEIANEGDDK